MAAQLDPAFLVQWVRAEVEDVAGQLAERRGLLDALERAAGDLWLSEVREARGATEKLERSGGAACVAWLRATPGAAARLERLARALAGEPGRAVAELAGLGGSPGCSTR